MINIDYMLEHEQVFKNLKTEWKRRKKIKSRKVEEAGQ